VSVVSCGYTEYFPPEKIHSGESDFDPPRFKPDPSVYLLAAKSEDADPKNCVAVEDRRVTTFTC
jgi:HAD superfamily hydrolase (TIGR01509 family)